MLHVLLEKSEFFLGIEALLIGWHQHEGTCSATPTLQKCLIFTVCFRRKREVIPIEAASSEIEGSWYEAHIPIRLLWHHWSFIQIISGFLGLLMRNLYRDRWCLIQTLAVWDIRMIILLGSFRAVIFRCLRSLPSRLSDTCSCSHCARIFLIPKCSHILLALRPWARGHAAWLLGLISISCALLRIIWDGSFSTEIHELVPWARAGAALVELILNLHAGWRGHQGWWIVIFDQLRLSLYLIRRGKEFRQTLSRLTVNYGLSSWRMRLVMHGGCGAWRLSNLECQRGRNIIHFIWRRFYKSTIIF